MPTPLQKRGDHYSSRPSSTLGMLTLTEVRESKISQQRNVPHDPVQHDVLTLGCCRGRDGGSPRLAVSLEHVSEATRYLL